MYQQFHVKTNITNEVFNCVGKFFGGNSLQNGQKSLEGNAAVGFLILNQSLDFSLGRVGVQGTEDFSDLGSLQIKEFIWYILVRNFCKSKFLQLSIKKRFRNNSTSKKYRPVQAKVDFLLSKRVYISLNMSVHSCGT